MLSEELKKLKGKVDYFSEWERKRIIELNEEYDKLIEFHNVYVEEDALYWQLIEALPEDLNALFVKYNHIVTIVVAFQQDFFYRNGFRDCFRSLKRLYPTIGDER